MRDRLEGSICIVSSPSENSRTCPACSATYGADIEFCPKDGSKLEESEQLIAGRFVLKARIGLGNMGTVHRAVQLPMGRQVAVKLLHPDLLRNPEMVARFEREALAASTVDHPNAITIYDSGRTETGQCYIAMEYLEGESLAAMLARQGPLPPMRAFELWVPVVKAMVVAHLKGIIHRDLKPDNVFISSKVSDEGTSEEIVKVLDFGIAKLLQGATAPSVGRVNTKTLAGTRLGTALYMAPEQLEGREAGKHSDVYALGLMLIEIMTGRLPWGRSAEEADTVMTMMRLVTPPKPLRDLLPGQVFSAELQLFFDEVLAVDPKLRPQDAGELLKRIARVPEAQFMARGASGGRRSDVSQMLSAAFMGSAIRSGADLEIIEEDQGDTLRTPGSGSGIRPPEPATQPLSIAKLPVSPVTDPILPRAKPLQVLETLKRDVPKELLPSTSADELPALPTAITSSSQNPAPLGLAGDGSQTVEFLRPSDDVPPANAARTLPQPINAPRIDVSPPTQPLLMARLAPDKVRSFARGESQTIETRGRSSDTMRRRRFREPNPLVLGLGIAIAMVLIGIAYLLLRPPPPVAKPPPPVAKPLPPVSTTVTPPVSSDVAPPVEKPKEPVKVASTDGDSKDETPRSDDTPTEKPDKPEKSDRRHRSKDKDREGEPLQVTFRLRTPSQANVQCGGEISHICDGVCTSTVAQNAQCTVRSRGFSTKRFKYDELEKKGRRGKVRLDITLVADKSP